MHKFLQLSFIFVLLLLSLGAHANKKELKKLLNKRELKQISAAEKIIAKGDNIIAEAKELEKEVKRLQDADGRIKTSKINKKSRQATELKMKAAVFFRDGYNKYIKILDSRLKDLAKDGNFEAHNKRGEIDQIQKKARKLYNKANNLSESQNKVELIEQAEAEQTNAIDQQTKFIIMALNPSALAPMVEKSQITILEESQFDKAEHEKKDSIVSDPVQTEQAVNTTEQTVAVTPPNTTVTETAATTANNVLTSAVNTENTEGITEKAEVETTKVEEAPVITQPEVKEEIIEAEPDIFLTIQFMADRQKATQTQIQSIYNGSKKVIVMELDGWYKYSIGKYQSMAEARSAMTSEKIKGFVVAYNKNKRISIKEALTILNQ